MRTTRRRSSNTGNTVEGTISSSESNGEHTSPLWLLVTAGAFGLAWFIFSTIQITSTIQAALSFLQSTYTITPGETAADLLKIQMSDLDSTTRIAMVIGWAIQITLLRTMLPSQHFTMWHLERVRTFITKVLIGADVLTDALYVLHGRTVFTDWHTLAPGGLGVLIIAVIYPIALISITVFCGIEMAHRIDRLIQCLKRIKIA